MSSFSSMLSAYIEESGMTIKYIAEKSGLDATLVTKLKNGSRRPANRDKMHQLFLVLGLSPADYTQLSNLCEIELMGKETYDKYKAVVGLIESTELNITLSPIEKFGRYN